MTPSKVRPRVVVSAVNFTEGGPLTVLRECLASAAATLPEEWELIALVHREDLVQEPRVRLLPIPDAKTSWLRRLYWEWIGFGRLSREWKPQLWLSLHDITPRVDAVRQAVYCHNPAPFHRATLTEGLADPRFLAFSLLYGRLYRAFIHRNHSVIVQQEWLRAEFTRRMGPLPTIVAYPTLPQAITPLTDADDAVAASEFTFLYPALPRVFKNIETLCEASRILARRGMTGFSVELTLDGTENAYAQRLRKRYGDLPSIRFIGRQGANDMRRAYHRASAVVFASKLETWGLPITEAKAVGRPLLLADLPYAREAVGTYGPVSFFPVDSAPALADLMQAMVQRQWTPTGHQGREPRAPFAPDWNSLWRMLIGGLPTEPSSPG